MWIRARYESKVRDSRVEHEAREEEKFTLLGPSPLVMILGGDENSP